MVGIVPAWFEVEVSLNGSLTIYIQAEKGKADTPHSSSNMSAMTTVYAQDHRQFVAHFGDFSSASGGLPRRA
jgi:hypothetical protein